MIGWSDDHCRLWTPLIVSKDIDVDPPLSVPNATAARGSEVSGSGITDGVERISLDVVLDETLRDAPGTRSEDDSLMVPPRLMDTANSLGVVRPCEP